MQLELTKDHMVSMRDGIRLATDVYLPERDKRLPTVFLRMPYNKQVAQSYVYAHPSWYARQGFAVVVQDVRGRYASEGDFYPMRAEVDDTEDALAWIRSQPFCNGRIGMYGFSYPGINQILAAGRRPTGLVTICPGFYTSSMYDTVHTGGAVNLPVLQQWAVNVAADTARKHGQSEVESELRFVGRHIDDWYPHRPVDEFPPLRKAGTSPHYWDFTGHPERDAFWEPLEIPSVDAVDLPALHIGGWYDTFIPYTLRSYERLAAMGRKPQHLLIGPWIHIPWNQRVGQFDFGPDSASGVVDDWQVQWFKHWLSDERPELNLPPVRMFVMGENKWRDLEIWPPRNAVDVRYFLHSDGSANSLYGDGTLTTASPAESEPPDLFIYDPHDPVQSLGGNSCCDPLRTPMGAFDQREVEMRRDVLVYSTEVLRQPLEVNGHVTATIYAASTATDTDFTATLVDVHPDGQAFNLCGGIVRARYRSGPTAPELLTPGTTYKYEIAVGPTANVFMPGHRIRLDVSSSNFPLYDSNPNHGGNIATARNEDCLIATQEVFHTDGQPSHLTLPVVRK